MQVGRALLAFCLALTIGSLSGHAEKRFALVMANSQYKYIPGLPNPVNDARLLADALKQQDFTVDEALNLDLKGMKRGLQSFFEKVQATEDQVVALVFYAGHGVQVHGVNYLIPTDASIDSEVDVQLEALSMETIMDLVAYSGSSLNIIILDACRNNPYMRRARSVSRGLARIDAPTDTVIAFSTAPGQIADDGDTGGNSPYTAALAKMIGEPGLRIEDVFKRVRQSVYAATQGKQVPWESSSLVGDFYPAGQRIASLEPGPAAAPPHATRNAPPGRAEDILEGNRPSAGRATAPSAIDEPASRPAKIGPQLQLPAETPKSRPATAAPPAEAGPPPAAAEATKPAKQPEPAPAPAPSILATPPAAKSSPASQAKAAPEPQPEPAPKPEQPVAAATPVPSPAPASPPATAPALKPAEPAPVAEQPQPAPAPVFQFSVPVVTAYEPAPKPSESNQNCTDCGNQRVAALEPTPPALPPATTILPAVKAGDVIRDCPNCPELVVMKTGEYMAGAMGGEGDGDSPQHKVSITSPFAVGRFEVTRDQFNAFVLATGYKVGDSCWTFEGNVPELRAGRSLNNPGYPQTGEHPAVCVNWADANAYVDWLSQISGHSYRLLNEGEWEFAARGGTTSRYAFGSNSGDVCKFANAADQFAKSAHLPDTWKYLNCNDGFAYTAPVGSFRPNGFGLYDMTGNVWEWTEDCHEDADSAHPKNGEQAASTCSHRVVRGGSWYGNADTVRVTIRGKAPADNRFDDIGLRVARDLAK